MTEAVVLTLTGEPWAAPAAVPDRFNHLVVFEADQQRHVNSILDRIKARTNNLPQPSRDEPVTDQMEWCEANTKHGWTCNLIHGGGSKWGFLFEDDQDAALFKLFWC